MSAAVVVGISDCKISSDTNVALTTYALGSCVGIALYDAEARIGGLLHVLLPNSVNNTRDSLNPFMFADTGIQKMVRDMMMLGANPTRLFARVAGGANMLNSSSVLDIGRKNINAVVETLEKTRMQIRGSSVGGTLGRSMQLDVGDGRVTVRYLGGGEIVI